MSLPQEQQVQYTLTMASTLEVLAALAPRDTWLASKTVAELTVLATHRLHNSYLGERRAMPFNSMPIISPVFSKILNKIWSALP
jgi:hypothetical protein